jgi:hypothetical protein
MSYVPPRRTCATMEIHKELALTNADYRINRLNIEGRMVAFKRAGAKPRGIVKIPVVVHVVYKSDEQNISKQQIQSQITALDKDYRKLNADIKKVPSAFKKYIGDARVIFNLAIRDPDGKPTDGITRTHTNVDSFSAMHNPVKSNKTGGADAWPRDRYLNLWCCSLGDELLGYAQFPGGPAETDGVVINYHAFGTMGTATAPYDKGRTATHEIGHWLNLLHIWGDDKGGCEGSDNVEDTPNQAGPNFDTPSFPHVTCDNGPKGDMFMNYMDYTPDAAMVMFTKGQIHRISATLDGPRAAIVNSDGLKKASKQTSSITLRSVAGSDKAKLVFNGIEWV